MQDGPSQLLRKTLKLVSIFEGLTEAEGAAFLRLARRQEVRADDVVVREGERGDDAYIVVRGHLRVSKRHAGVAVELATLAPGDAFGELSIIDDGPRSATVNAQTDATLLRFNRESLGLQPTLLLKVVTNIARLLAKRLREANQRTLDASLAPHNNRAPREDTSPPPLEDG